MKSIFKLKPIAKELWKYKSLRPSNFPSIRIAQFTSLYYKQSPIFQKLLAAKNIKELRSQFLIQASPYWNSHFTLGVKSKNNQIKRLGKICS